MKLLIIGASGHGKVAVDIALRLGYTWIKFLDDNVAIDNCMGYEVIHDLDDLQDSLEYDYFVAIGNAEIRERFLGKLIQAGLCVVTLVHPDAVIGKEVSIGRGTVIMAGAVINPCTRIGDGCIVNTGATIDHDCVIGDFVHVSVGSHLAGTVSIGKSTWIGIGAVVSNNITICESCMIGAGAVVVKDIQEAGTYVGVPVKRMKEV